MNNITDQIVSILEKYRKRIGNEVFDSSHIYNYLEQRIINNQEILFVFPTLHGKSINLSSVFNHLPDAGDILAIETIEKIVGEISYLYRPGVKIAIVHEGHFYVRVGIVHTDYLLDGYLTDLLGNLVSPNIKLYKINDFFPSCSSYDQMRDQFYEQFVPSKATVNKLINTDLSYAKQYTKYMCFIKNEFAEQLCHSGSKSATKLWLKRIAREQLRVYIGLSRLMETHFKNHLRISALYKSVHELDKFAIELIPQNRNFATPGFNILCKDANSRFYLQKRKNLDLTKMMLRYFKDGRYPYYQEVADEPILLLDFDGVICDNSEIIGYQLLSEILEQQGFSFSPIALAKEFVGKKLEAIEQILNARYNTAVINNSVIKTFRSQYSKYLEQHACKVDRIDTLLTAFSIKYICTSNHKEFVLHFLEKNNLDHLFSGSEQIISLTDVINPKPAPDLYQKCIELARRDFPSSKKFLALEDSYSGVIAAKAANVDEVLGFVGSSSIIDKAYQENQLLAAGANHVFHDMLHLKQYVFDKYRV